MSGRGDVFLAKIYPGSLSLSVQREGANDVAISWPGLFANYELQSTALLMTTNTWATVSNPAVVIGTNIVVTYTNTIGNSFYRLQPRP